MLRHREARARTREAELVVLLVERLSRVLLNRDEAFSPGPAADAVRGAGAESDVGHAHPRRREGVAESTGTDAVLAGSRVALLVVLGSASRPRDTAEVVRARLLLDALLILSVALALV